MKRIILATLLTAASSFGATVAEMSGTVFTHDQFAQRAEGGIPVAAFVAIAAGMVTLFSIMTRKGQSQS
jgi:hypothetical protein